jgi:hypothetical protein
MASAGSAQIEARGGDNWKVSVNGQVVPDYAKVQGERHCSRERLQERWKSSHSPYLTGVLLGVVIAWTLIMTLLGPENVSRSCSISLEVQIGI